jgi:hypothetical protein
MPTTQRSGAANPLAAQQSRKRCASNDISALNNTATASMPNFIRNETLTEANACLVAAQNSIPLPFYIIFCE